MNVGLGRIAGGAAGMIDKLGLTKELSKVMAAAESGMGLEGSLKNLTKVFEQALGAAGGGIAAGAAQSVNQGSIEKLMYLSVLRGALQKAAESKHFNMETQVNDLWVKLSQVKQQKSSESTLRLQQMIEKQAQMQQMLSNIMKAYHDAATSVIRNIK
jgi:hypothetical protein